MFFHLWHSKSVLLSVPSDVSHCIQICRFGQNFVGVNYFFYCFSVIVDLVLFYKSQDGLLILIWSRKGNLLNCPKDLASLSLLCTFFQFSSEWPYKPLQAITSLSIRNLLLQPHCPKCTLSISGLFPFDILPLELPSFIRLLLLCQFNNTLQSDTAPSQY